MARGCSVSSGMVEVLMGVGEGRRDDRRLTMRMRCFMMD